MEKRQIIIANWKMKMGLGETVRLAEEIALGIPNMTVKNSPQVVLCPSYIAMDKVSDIIKDTKITLGSQDVFWEDNGAYTGEISISMLKELGCRYIMIGHSERRQYLGETDEMVKRKVKAVLAAGLEPIVCVGETREERNQGKKDYRVSEQITKAFEGVDVKDSQQVIIAYEPVWVIGTGQAVDSLEAKYMANLIKHVALDFCPKENMRLIYGGSVDSGNIGEFADVDGFLVGTASLDAREFLEMIGLMG